MFWGNALGGYKLFRSPQFPQNPCNSLVSAQPFLTIEALHHAVDQQL